MLVQLRLLVVSVLLALVVTTAAHADEDSSAYTPPSLIDMYLTYLQDFWFAVKLNIHDFALEMGMLTASNCPQKGDDPIKTKTELYPQIIPGGKVSYCGHAAAQMAMCTKINGTNKGCMMQEDIDKITQENEDFQGRYHTTEDNEQMGSHQNLSPREIKGILKEKHIPYQIIDTEPEDDESHEEFRGRLLDNICYWMKNTGYPAIVWANNGNHWVVVSEIRYDKSSNNNSNRSNYKLKVLNIWVKDISQNPESDSEWCDTKLNSKEKYCGPGPDGFTHLQKDNLPVHTFFDEHFLRIGPNFVKYTNKHVYLVDPPLLPGRTILHKKLYEGPVIGHDEAIRRAISYQEETSFLPDTHLSRAFLVNKDYGGYYIVPADSRGGGASIGAIKINAYSGQFEAAQEFHKPITYLSWQQAKQNVLKDIGAHLTPSAGAELVFEFSEQTPSSFRPAWKVTIPTEEGTLDTRYVDQAGKVFPRLTPVRPMPVVDDAEMEEPLIR